MGHHAATDAGAQDDGEGDGRAGRRAVGGLGQGQAIGVVGEPHGLAQGLLQVGMQGLADEPGGVGVLH